MSNHWQTAVELTDSSTAFVTVTLISSRGHVPQDLGAKIIVTAKGLHQGTVGGGKVEAKAIEHAKYVLQREIAVPELLTWNLTTDVGMTCGGEVSFLFEKHNPRHWNIALFGAGHVGLAVAETLEKLDCHLSCFDTRAEWMDRLPKAVKVSKIHVQDLPAQVNALSKDTFFIVMTQGHSTDMPILENIFRTFPDAPYVGVMGSDVKAAKIRHELKERGISEELIKKLRSPIGLPIGSNSPYEIAISVTAELLQFRSIWEDKLATRGKNAL